MELFFFCSLDEEREVVEAEVMSQACMQELGKFELQDSSGGKFYNFTQQYIEG